MRHRQHPTSPGAVASRTGPMLALSVAVALIASLLPAVAQPAPRRPACPPGWTDFKSPELGLQAHVPTNYWVRLHGGLMLTVELQSRPSVAAFLVPLRPRKSATADAIARHFSELAARGDPRWRAKLLEGATPTLAKAQFTSSALGQPTEGRYCAVVAAEGSMAYVIGVSAPAGELEARLPELQRIAQGFGFTAPRGRWVHYTSPAGGFTMSLPDGWPVQSGDGQSPKDNIDWVTTSPARPLSRAFQWCPRFCSPQLLQDPLHVLRGYQAGQFSSPEQVLLTSLGQISQNPRLLKIEVNRPLTELFTRMNQQVAQLLAGLGAGQSSITVYDCLAEATVEGRPVIVAFAGGIQTLVMPGGIFGALTDLSVTLRGWCAAPEHFLTDTPVLERICSSMQLSPAFLRRIAQSDARAADKIRETYATMNQIDNQIRQEHWDTMDAVAEMNYDLLRDVGGYVNESTHRIEQLPANQVVRNRQGDLVSREEVDRGVDVEQATVLRDASSSDYMRGVYGRIEF